MSRYFSISVLFLSLSISPVFAAAIGGVETQTGTGVIARDGQKVPSKIKSEVMMNDTIESKDGDMGIKFVDDTAVAISPGSELVIDEFVFDPANADKSKLSLDVVGGTVRYASGAIAHQNSQNVAINTPSATIAVRGTNFTATVDEIGRSQIILLPNLDGTVGEIEVKNMGGSVILNQAFQAVVVQSLERAPSDPKILNISPDDINNMMILKPPKELVDDYVTTVKNALDIDYLEYDELKQDLLDSSKMLDYNGLSVKPLDKDYLQNQLDAEAAAFAAEMQAILEGVTQDGNIPGYNSLTQVVTAIQSDGTRIIDRSVIHIANISVSPDTDYSIYIKQDGLSIPIKIGLTESVKINIVQSQ